MKNVFAVAEAYNTIKTIDGWKILGHCCGPLITEHIAFIKNIMCIEIYMDMVRTSNSSTVIKNRWLFAYIGSNYVRRVNIQLASNSLLYLLFTFVTLYC